jgi:hypothetical protein
LGKKRVVLERKNREKKGIQKGAAEIGCKDDIVLELENIDCPRNSVPNDARIV